MSAVLCCLFAATFSVANTDTAKPVPPAAPAASEQSVREALSYGDAAVLGLVEGVTEYLPVSSTGHLILTGALLGLDDTRPVLDAQGQPLWLRAPKADSHGGVPMTIEAATNTYLVVIQVGAIAAVLLLFWSYVWKMLQGLLGRDPQGLKLLINVGIAVVPAVVLGLTLHDWIDEHLFSVKTVAAALVVGSGIMFAAEAWRRRRDGANPGEGPQLWELTPLQALTVGLMQCVAMWPGMSRSMMTIVGGYVAGLSPRRAAEFSFLVGLPTLAGASLLKGVKTGPAMVSVFGWGPVLFGFLIAAISAAIAVRWLVGWLQSRGLALFAWYRLVLAVVVLLVVYG